MFTGIGILEVNIYVGKKSNISIKMFTKNGAQFPLKFQ